MDERAQRERVERYSDMRERDLELGLWLLLGRLVGANIYEWKNGTLVYTFI